ncbi:hypothetical protein LI328DRAFT_34668 [Trichoderma asperelloides]|nr:hypothetical protein LI328DRAFT_34668 [Trichoderma asperelloides]
MPLAASPSVRGFFWDVDGLCTAALWCAANCVAPLDPVASKGPHAVLFLTVEGKCQSWDARLVTEGCMDWTDWMAV